jgi:hypothetical protein
MGKYMRKVATLFIALIAAAIIAPLAPATAGPEDDSDDSTVVEPMPGPSQANTVIQEWVEAQSEDTGFAGALIPPDGMTLIVSWRGSISAAAKAVIAKAEEYAPVSIRHVPYSSRQIDVAIHEVMDTAERLDLRLEQLGPKPDHSGVLVTVATPEAAQRARASLVARVPFDVRVIPGHNRPMARRTDTPPFWGGSALISAVDNYRCTAAFPVVSSSGTPGLVTAYHCGVSQTYKTYSGSVVGTAHRGQKDIDAVFISGGASYGTRVFDGNWDSNDNAEIHAGANPAVGDQVCVSGGYEGIHCKGVFVKDEPGQYQYVSGDWTGPGYHLWRGDVNDDGVFDPIGGGGDSGSPVFNYHDIALSQVTIRGMMVSMETTHHATPCTGSPGLTRTCSYNVFVVQIGAIKKQMGINLKTS